MNRQIDRQMDKQMDRQIDRQIDVGKVDSFDEYTEYQDMQIQAG